MVDGVLRCHSLKVIDLAAAKDGGQNLVFLGGGRIVDNVGRRLFERLEERIEGGG